MAEGKSTTEHTGWNGQRCACGDYHYRCEVCGIDCTAGTKGGPCTQDTDKVHRCRECQRKHEGRKAVLHSHAQELVGVLHDLVRRAEYVSHHMTSSDHECIQRARALLAKIEEVS